MKDKHIHIPADSQLLKLIYAEVKEKLVPDKKYFYTLIWAKFFVYVSLNMSSYFLLYQLANPIAFITCFVFYGLVTLLFAFNFSHDFSHNTVFKSKRLNNFGFTAIYTLVGAHAEAWKQRHVHSHHYAPNVKDYDSDLKITSLIRVIPKSEYRWFHRYQHLYAPILYTTYSLFWIFIKDFNILYSKDEFTAKKDWQYHLSFWVQKTVYFNIIFLLPLLYSKQTVWTILIAFLLMHLIQSLFLLFTFFMTHHVEATAYPTTDEAGFINTSWIMNQIKSSNDMHPFSEVANFIFGGFNNHIVHHLFPHVHHIYYPRLNRLLYQILLEHNVVPNQTSYFGGVVSHLKLLKLRGKLVSHELLIKN